MQQQFFVFNVLKNLMTTGQIFEKIEARSRIQWIINTVKKGKKNNIQKFLPILSMASCEKLLGLLGVLFSKLGKIALRKKEPAVLTWLTVYWNF